MKTVIVLFIALVSFSTVYVVRQATQADEPKSIFNYSKEEYLELAVRNCAKDGQEAQAYCRCVYRNLLDRYTVREVLRFDADVTAQGDAYAFSDEQIKLVARCL